MDVEKFLRRLDDLERSHGQEAEFVQLYHEFRWARRGHSSPFTDAERVLVEKFLMRVLDIKEDFADQWFEDHPESECYDAFAFDRALRV